METRHILHVDQNCFFASVEMCHHPEWRNVPMAVGGDSKQRHGIILAKNYLAQAQGVKTAEAIWQAKQKCPDLLVVPAHFEQYVYYSERIREMFLQYTDKVEPFGLDECWLDITGTTAGTPVEVADEIRQRVKVELGLSCSVGVSFNKTFAKLGSDYKKPDATTEITKENFRTLVWPLPVSDLLYVGRATNSALGKMNVKTIGDLASLSPDFVVSVLGKNGQALWRSANGLEDEPVRQASYVRPLKSIGNSTTTPRDMTNREDVWKVICTLSAQVAARLRKHHFYAGTVTIWVRDTDLKSYEKQRGLPKETNDEKEIAELAMELFDESYDWHAPLRSFGVRTTHLSDEQDYHQMTIFENVEKTEKDDRVNRALDGIRARYGYNIVMRGTQMEGKGDLCPEDREDHPHGGFKEDV
ncbi:MAG: DNA polymerase IV [Clostridiales bacterium]|nr:DNA polymerase IV [Clostridiales bacterium]